MPESRDYYRGAIAADVLEESALAMAQSTIQNAMDDAGITKSEMARRMGCNRSFVTKMMKGNYSLTVKTLARALGACGVEFRSLPSLPPAEPQPVDYWGLVEELEAMLRNMTGNLAGVNRPYKGNDQLPGDAGQFYKAYNAGIDSAHEFSVRLANKALARIAAARKERGA